MGLNKVFKPLVVSSHFKKSHHIDWVSLDSLAAKVLSTLLKKSFEVEGTRSDYYNWSLNIHSTPLTNSELEVLYQIDDVDDYDRELHDESTPVMEICQSLSRKLINLSLPFKAVESFADDEGVWFIGSQIKLFFFTFKVQNRDGKQIATKTGVMYAEDVNNAHEKIWAKYGNDLSYGLEVWEVNEESESFCVYKNI